MPDEMKKTELTICENKLSELTRLAPWIEDISEKWELPAPLVFTLNLVLEEAFTNIVNYAYADEDKHEIEIQMDLQGNMISIILTDDGKAFDPTLRKDPDVTLPAEERDIGGLGIYLIRQMMDHVTYNRQNNKNVLRMSKVF